MGLVRKVLSKFKKFANTDLFKTSIWNGIATVIRLLTGLVSNKIVAIYLGPSGVALLGQFGNFSNMANSIASFGINVGITKYIAEYRNDEAARWNILSTGLKITLIATFLTSIIIFILARPLCISILETDKYLPLFYIFSVTLVLFTLNAFLISVLNGFKEFRKIIFVNITSSLVGLGIAVLLIIEYGLWGAFIGVILSTTLISFVTFGFVLKSPWFQWKYFTKKFNILSASKLSKYTLMSFTTMFAVTYVQLMVRTYIINNLSIQEAGFWQGIIKISDIYMLVITTTLSYYYLPRLSEIIDKVELRNEIIRGYKFILPLTIISSALVFIFRESIIDLLYTAKFQPMKELFLFQVIGNIFKIASWLIAYLMVAKAMAKTYIITEIIFGLSFYLFTLLFLKHYGSVGVTMAYCLNRILYFIIIVLIFRKTFFIKKE